MHVTLKRIVSGGQTGVDRGALDAALAAGFPCGGWCPQGREAEDGPIDPRYPLAELTGAGYLERTLQNVIDSDGTAIIHSGALEGGTRQTLDYCASRRRPCVVIDASAAAADVAARELAAFIDRHRVAVLNLAGPRASKWPGAHAYTREALAILLENGG